MVLKFQGGKQMTAKVQGLSEVFSLQTMVAEPVMSEHENICGNAHAQTSPERNNRCIILPFWLRHEIV